MESFNKSKLSKAKKIIVELLSVLPTQYCRNAHNKNEYHDISEECPAEKRIMLIRDKAEKFLKL